MIELIGIFCSIPLIVGWAKIPSTRTRWTRVILGGLTWPADILKLWPSVSYRPHTWPEAS